MDYKYSDNYANRPRRRPNSVATVQEETMPTHAPHIVVPAESSQREYLKLGGILLLIVICATVMSTVLGFDWQEWMRWFMGGFFVIFGSFKLIGYEMFIMMFPTYDPIAKRFPLYNYFYPFIEL